MVREREALAVRSHGGCVPGDNGTRAVLQHDQSGSKDAGVWRQDYRVGACHVASLGSQLAVTDPCQGVAW